MPVTKDALTECSIVEKLGYGDVVEIIAYGQPTPELVAKLKGIALNLRDECVLSGEQIIEVRVGKPRAGLLA